MFGIVGMGAARKKASQPVKDGGSFDPSLYGSMSEQELLEASREFVSGELSAFEPVQRNELIGIDHHVESVDHIADRLRHFALPGVDVDGGACLWGKPGTGKTLLARYLATISGAMFVNVALFPRKNATMQAQDVSRLYRVSRETVGAEGRPVLLFWDEFDGFAKLGEEPSAQEKEAISTLKGEISGIAGKARGVFLVVTMNSHPGSLDAALFRAGRIGKVMQFTAPNRQGRRDLLRYYLHKVSGGRVSDNLGWYDTLSYFVGSRAMPSDIEEIANEIWTNAVLRAKDEGKRPYIRLSDPTAPLIRRYAGDPSNVVRSDDSRRHIATRLAAAALVARTQGIPVQLIACFTQGHSKVDLMVESDETDVETLQGKKDEIALAFSGSIAEVMLGFATSVASSEQRAGATTQAQVFVERYGANDLRIAIGSLSGARRAQHIPPHVPEQVFRRSTKVIDNLLREQEGVARKILESYGADRIRALVDELLEKEYLLQQQIDRHVRSEFRVEQAEGVATFEDENVNGIGQYL